MRAVSVEFCGLPGAGKSWVAPRVEEQLRSSGHPARLITATGSPESRSATRAAAKALLATSQLLHQPTLTAVVAAAAARDPQRRPQDRVRKLVNWLAAQELLRRREGTPGIHLFDEGPIQALWSIGLWGDHRRLTERPEGRPNLLRLTDLLVVVRVDPERADQRLAGRGDPHSRIERLTSSSERRHHLRQGASLLDELVSLWEGHTGRSALVVAGDDGPVSPDGCLSLCGVADAITPSAEARSVPRPR